MKYALIGEKLGHSYSRVIHEKYFKIKNINASYDLIEIPKHELFKQVSNINKSGYAGYNVTIPFKIDLMNMCTHVSQEAKRIGSVNTIYLKDSIMHGYNTDYHGLRLALEYNGVNLKNKNIVILGTGGASKSCQVLCEDSNCKSITLVSRSENASSHYKTVTYNSIPKGDIVINTTPVGMYPDLNKTPLCSFGDFDTAVDLIYNPATTKFLNQAKNSGAKTVNGLYMLVAQAIYSQSIWNNDKVDFNIINNIYNEMRGELNENNANSGAES